MKKISILAFVILSAASAASAAVSIKLTGGMVYLFANDYDKGVKGAYDYISDNFNEVTGTYGSFRFGQNFGGEVIVSLDRTFSLGLGGGYFLVAKQSAFGYKWSTYSEEETYKPRLSLIPITLNLHYFLPLSGALSLDVFGGLGYYLARFQYESRLTTDFFSYEQTKTFNARKNVFGLQGGIGLEFRLNSLLGFILQVEGRMAALSDPRGDWTEQESWFLGVRQAGGADGSFWYYEKNDSERVYPQVTFSNTEPSDPSFSNIRKGTINLSGISAAAGLKIRF